MPVLTRGVAVRSRNAAMLVENQLEVGSWRFRLTVLNRAGIESDPAELVVRVVPPTLPPGPVIPTVDPRITQPQTPVSVAPIRPRRRRPR
jgi:hypothetical protein